LTQMTNDQRLDL